MSDSLGENDTELVGELENDFVPVCCGTVGEPVKEYVSVVDTVCDGMIVQV